MLYQFGALTIDQVEKCMSIEGKRVGDAAVEFGFLTREKSSISSWESRSKRSSTRRCSLASGMFYFLDRYDESRLMSRYNISANSLLMEGVRRMDEMSYFRERVPSENHVPTKVQGKADPV